MHVNVYEYHIINIIKKIKWKCAFNCTAQYVKC